MLNKIFAADKKNRKETIFTGKKIINSRFTIDTPSDWEDQSVYRLQKPQGDDPGLSITINIENSVDTDNLEVYADLQISALRSVLQGYHELKTGETCLENKIPAYEIVYKWSPLKEKTMYHKIFYILYNNISHTITHTIGYTLTAAFSTKKSYKINSDKVDKILKSFKPSFLKDETGEKK